MTTTRPERYRAGKRLWNATDDAQLRARYPHERTASLAKSLRRTLQAVYARVALLGLRKSDRYLASPAACRLRRGDHVGARTRFQKGHVPANKGLKRPGWHRGRMKETQFKPGRRNGRAAEHYMPVGSTRLVDGYVYRKVSDAPNVPYTVNWKPDHRLIWAAAHGPLPPGHVLQFCNGNPLDVRLENLKCISRQRLMLCNSIHKLPKPLAETVRALGALNRQIRQRTIHAQQD